MDALHHLAAIIGSKFCIKSYPLLGSSQHVGATAALSKLRVVFSCELPHYAISTNANCMIGIFCVVPKC